MILNWDLVVYTLTLELPAEESKMDVDDFISYLNKLYKKKSKYIQIQKDDKKNLEKAIYFIVFKYYKFYLIISI